MSRPKRLGLLLEVKASAGGMFQYSQAALDAFVALAQTHELRIACTSRVWEPYLRDVDVPVTWLRGADLADKLSLLLKALLLPGWLARAVSAAFSPFYRQMKPLDCDLWVYPATDALGYQLPFPALLAIHDLMHRYERRFPEVAGGWRYPVRENRFGALARWARGILVDSAVGREHVVACYGVEATKIHILPFVPPRYIFAQHDAGDVVARYGLPHKFFFYPAQLWSHKNHKTLISAAALLKDRIPDIHFVFTGKGRHTYDELVAHARMLGVENHITFLGYVPDEDLPALYRAARALVMATFLGPTNIPPLEAFACDCPVAVARVYAMPEQLGDAALYFAPRSAEDIALVLDRLWHDDALCEDLKARGRERLGNWTQAHFAQRFGEIVASVLPPG